MISRRITTLILALAAIAFLGAAEAKRAATKPPAKAAATAAHAQAKSYGAPSKLLAIQGPADGIAGLAIRPDAKVLAYGSYGDNAIHLVDLAGGKEVRKLEGHTRPVTSLAYSADGRLLASTGTVSLPPGTDGSVRIWDPESGKELASFETKGVQNLEFSPDGKLLAAAGIGDPMHVLLWDVEHLAKARELAHVFRIGSFDPSGTTIVSGARDNKVHLIDVASGTEKSALEGHKEWVRAAAFNRKGDLLATASDDGVINLWDPKSWTIARSLSGHTTEVEFLTFSPDGKVLASLANGIKSTGRSGGMMSFTLGHEDKELRLWDTAAGKQLRTLSMPEDIDNVAMSPDWSVIATGNSKGLIQIWSVH